MSITFGRAYVANGKTYATLRAAQESELTEMIRAEITESGEGTTPEAIAALLVTCGDRVIDVLTTKENSKPRARAINGGRKTRRKPADPAQQTLPEPKQAA